MAHRVQDGRHLVQSWASLAPLRANQRVLALVLQDAQFTGASLICTPMGGRTLLGSEPFCCVRNSAPRAALALDQWGDAGVDSSRTAQQACSAWFAPLPKGWRSTCQVPWTERITPGYLRLGAHKLPADACSSCIR